jgi:hypothetical protein
MLLEEFELNPVVNVTALIVFPAFLVLLSYRGVSNNCSNKTIKHPPTDK